MTNPRGFMQFERIENRYRPVRERIRDYDEVETQLPQDMRPFQAARCMDCGVPFCHWGCPVGSLIPEWQDRLQQGDWKAAYDILQKTNNFPEFTGRLCPAPCESACTLGINDDPVTIRENELAVIEHAFAEDYVKARPPQRRTGKKVAVIGSGPAGLACADTLNKAGHSVVLYEAADAVGGYLRYGVPDFKLSKSVIDRRVDLMLQEGVVIHAGVKVGRDLPAHILLEEYDAACIAIGARNPRDLSIPGRELLGIHQAVDYLEQQNRVVRGETIPDQERITAEDKHVVVLGGGDTGSDCIGTANRQGAKNVTQVEIMPAFPRSRAPHEPWPLWPRLYRVSSSHAEGCERLFNVLTRAFIAGKNSRRVKRLTAVQVEWVRRDDGRREMIELPDSMFDLKAELVLLALGFVGIEREGLVSDLNLARDSQGNIAINDQHMTSVDGIFAAGDAHRGASLVVWAIHAGRQAADGIDAYLNALKEP